MLDLALGAFGRYNEKSFPITKSLQNRHKRKEQYAPVRIFIILHSERIRENCARDFHRRMRVWYFWAQKKQTGRRLYGNRTWCDFSQVVSSTQRFGFTVFDAPFYRRLQPFVSANKPFRKVLRHRLDFMQCAKIYSTSDNNNAVAARWRFFSVEPKKSVHKENDNKTREPFFPTGVD